MHCIQVTLCVLFLSVFVRSQVVELRYPEVSEAGQPVRDGMVFITFANIPRPICNEGFDNFAATVVCRQLGFSNGLSLAGDRYEASLPNSLQGEYWITQLVCTGDEAEVTDCSYPGIGQSLDNCKAQGSGNYASVACFGERATTTVPTTTTTTIRTTTTPEKVCDNPDPNIRLVDADDQVHPYEGRVQVLSNGVWYEICDDLWGQDDARVVARMLCYNTSDARAHVGGYLFGNRTADAYLMTWVRCNGSEASIFECESSTDTSSCTIQEPAAVSVRESRVLPPAAPVSEVTCDGDTETMTVSFEKSSNPGLEPSHLSLRDRAFASCATTGETSTDVFITFSLLREQCGTVKEFNDTYIIYMNQVQHLITSTSSITREQSYLISVICLMGRNGDPENEVNPETITVPPVYGEGEPLLEINIYETTEFRTKVSQLPAQFQLGTRVAVAMELFTDDPELKVILQQCYVTPGEAMDSTPQFMLIEEKCAVESSVVLYPVSETMYGFSFLIFEFTNVTHNLLYLHCKGVVCGITEKYGRCDRTCGTGTGGIDTGRKRRSAYSEVFFSSPLDGKRMRRQAEFEPFELEADGGPIYILRGDEAVITPTPWPVNTTQHVEGQSSVKSTERATDLHTERIELQSTDQSPALVQDYPQASTATLIQITLSLLLSIVMALILT